MIPSQWTDKSKTFEILGLWYQVERDKYKTDKHERPNINLAEASCSRPQADASQYVQQRAS